MDETCKHAFVYAQSGTHMRFNRWIISVLTSNPSVLMCVEITDAPILYVENGYLLRFQGSVR